MKVTKSAFVPETGWGGVGWGWRSQDQVESHDAGSLVPGGSQGLLAAGAEDG